MQQIAAPADRDPGFGEAGTDETARGSFRRSRADIRRFHFVPESREQGDVVGQNQPDELLAIGGLYACEERLRLAIPFFAFHPIFKFPISIFCKFLPAQKFGRREGRLIEPAGLVVSRGYEVVWKRQSYDFAELARLRFEEGLSLRQIAAKFGIPRTTVVDAIRQASGKS